MYVIEEIKRVVMEPYFIEKLVGRMNSERSNVERPLQEEKKRLFSNKQKIEKHIDNLVTMIMDDPDLRDIYSNKLKDQKQHLNSIEERILTADSQLTNVNTDPIDTESLKHLLQNLDSVLEHTDAAEKKELLALFIKDIQISKEKVSFKKGRQIKAIKLMFDFTIDALQGSTGSLVNQMGEINCVVPVDFSFMNDLSYKENAMREALASLNLLPLFMIRFPSINPKSPINLLNQHQLHQLMRIGNLSKRYLLIRPLHNSITQA